MQHLLVTISDHANIETLTTVFMNLKGAEHVETIDSETNWKNELHLPGPPLTDAQMEELVIDMEADTVAIPADKVWQEFKERFKNK